MSRHAQADDRSTLLTQLTLSLGQVRAEYSADDEVFSTFSMPVYWGDIVGTRPCVLVGGRGTGKTTTLRGLAYGGQRSLRGVDINNWDAIGAYWRIDSMVVSAFAGRGVSDSDWILAFSHYVNLKMVGLYLEFCEWRERILDTSTEIDPSAIGLAAESLHLERGIDLATLRASVKLSLATLEAKLNGSTAALFELPFSLLGRPLAYLLDGLRLTDIAARLPFTFCIDEFENLKPYQQRAINTLIKHVGDSRYTIKIGIRDTEQRERETLAEGQHLVDPADYTTVNIVEHLKEQSFSRFASQVCEQRLAATGLKSLQMVTSFPGLSTEEEAKLLGAERERQRIRQQLTGDLADEGRLAYFDSLGLLSACLVGYWAKTKATSVLSALLEAEKNPRAWEQRVGNYSYSMLFTFRRGRRGIPKFYAGWATYCQIANGNIRLLLELTYQALSAHISSGALVTGPVAPGVQTEAAAAVGKSTLRELQGQSGIGGQLTRLTLSLGRVFNVFAAAPEGHAPEVNQVRVESAGAFGRPPELEALLREAVASGCLVAFPGNKQERVSAQTKSNDYQLHPIFAPYFTYSHRRKRRIQISVDEFLALSDEHASGAIHSILHSRRVEAKALPEQLEFYGEFYNVAD